MSKPTWEIAENRFGFGAKSDKRITRIGKPTDWLMSQIKPLIYSNELGNSNEILKLLKAYRQEKSAERKMQNTGMQESDVKSQTSMPETNFKQTRKEIQSIARALTQDTLTHAITTEDSFQARLLDFFSNHFSVSANGVDMRALAPTLEREAIAPMLAGRFEDMLLAVEMHPAMLIYLDNEKSIGSDSRIGKKRKKRGLNENLAREILELHTLGVKATYSQTDVKELAMALTGWSVEGHKKSGSKREQHVGFVFKKYTHQPGSREVLGKTYVNTQSAAQGENILRDLARHPNTAQHLSYKLARHFISDKPDTDLLEAMTKAWLNSQGNLKVVLTAMLEHPASWQVQQAKYKTPREFVFSTYRACGPKKLRPKQISASLILLGQQPFSAGSPAGFGDIVDDWNGSEALLARVEWAAKFSSSLNSNTDKSAVQIAQSVLGKQLSDKTARMLKFAESRQRALTLFLMSPEFLRR